MIKLCKTSFEEKSTNRKNAIEKYFYNEKDGWYYDYLIDTNKLSKQKTIAGITPFFFILHQKKK